jgi:hypothetical protein
MRESSVGVGTLPHLYRNVKVMQKQNKMERVLQKCHVKTKEDIRTYIVLQLSKRREVCEMCHCKKKEKCNYLVIIKEMEISVGFISL